MREAHAGYTGMPLAYFSTNSRESRQLQSKLFIIHYFDRRALTCLEDVVG